MGAQTDPPDPRFAAALLDEPTRRGARLLAERTGAARHDVLVVLGSGLASALDGADGWGSPAATLALSDLPGVLAPVADGHVDELRSYERDGARVLVALGRTHLYEGVEPARVTALARIAAAAGAGRAVLANANGCLRDWGLGDVMAITDHVNLSGSSPLTGPLFCDPTGTWDAGLARVLDGVCQRSGTYAILRGPEYQTRAETRILAALGVDCVGMSTVMEALTLHALGVRVAGMSVVSDLSFADSPTDPTAVVEAATAAGATVRTGVEAVIAS
ncbi:purine-nucleoside phosphorylase [Actinomyces sp. B33]|uniref:purine-nucleoside phosphorylase n=1 Tax=Actinomyces sp. B33 TaxID=2942131 RepID=UPI00233FE3E6|nr:purine-nucleoside phosphorylase [Actinomyces sp. B33]MDC4232767.1 purine-nucleoside phosphorylase [Actinomyces sp. B33]